MIRSFLAFELLPDMKKIVNRVSDRLRVSTIKARWVRKDNIHLTIVFLGDIHEDQVPLISQAIKKVCSRYGPFHVSLKGLGAFPNTRRPRVIWLGLGGDLEQMSFFKKALEKHLKPFGVKEEKRSFKPHLTLGRFRKPYSGDSELDNFVARYKDLSSSECLLEKLVLFKSDLKPSGAEYIKLESWPLLGK